ncbi:NimC/NimA family protein [Bacteroides sp. KG68]|uniref:hypothetical protein n=1 Tax=unclassified Bacteroides TaxID=2646097 RepID=UPI003D959FBF
MEGIKKVYDFMDEAKNFYFATVEGDQPRVRVYGAVLLFENKIYLMVMNGTKAPAQLAENPKFEACAFKGKWLRLSGKLVPDGRAEVKKAMIEKMPPLGESLGEEGLLMYYVKDATAVFADMKGEIETIIF